MADGQDPAPRTDLVAISERLERLEKLGAIQALPVAQDSKSLATSTSNNSQAIEDRIANAATPQEAMDWVQVDRSFKDQKRADRELEHIARMQLMSLRAKIGVSSLAIISGCTLTTIGVVLATPAAVAILPPAGLFCLGAGLYGLAPEFVKENFSKLLRIR